MNARELSLLQAARENVASLLAGGAATGRLTILLYSAHEALVAAFDLAYDEATTERNDR